MYNGVLAPNADISLVLPDAIAALMGFPAMEPGNGRDAALRHCREVRHSIAITAPLCWFDPGVRRPADSADRADVEPAGPR